MLNNLYFLNQKTSLLVIKHIYEAKKKQVLILLHLFLFHISNKINHHFLILFHN